MKGNNAYRDLAGIYAAGVNAFFSGGAPAEGERAGAGPVPIAMLTARAETLAPVSAELTSAATVQLAADDPSLRVQASIGLLAKALTDLEVSRALFGAAEEKQDEATLGRSLAEIERSAAVTRPTQLDDTLRLLLGEEAEGPELAERGFELPATIEDARAQLAQNAQAILMLIRDRAASTGWEALGGVAKLGAGQLAQAAGLVSLQVADALGQAAQLTRLYALVRTFLGEAYASLQALLGPALTQIAGDKAVEWIKEAASGEKFAKLVEKYYATEPAGEALAKLATESSAGLAQYIAALEGIDALEVVYRKQVDIVGKILTTLRFVAFVPAAALPQGRLLMAATYILVGGYIVLAGADYVDAPGLTYLDRVSGVRRQVEGNLTQP